MAHYKFLAEMSTIHIINCFEKWKLQLQNPVCTLVNEVLEGI